MADEATRDAREYDGPDRAKVPASRRRALRELTSFIGRRAELADLEHLVQTSRLVSVVGPPGIGKTRTARYVVETSSTLKSAFCDLRGATSAEDLVTRIAEELRVNVDRGHSETLSATVEAALKAAPYDVLVLDNFEQLVPTGLGVLQRWSERLPNTCIVVTSRRMLRLYGERTLELAPLSLSRSEQRFSETAQLFIERARAIEPTFVPKPATVIEGIAEHLGGLPLAVELAASQMRRLRPHELLSRLELGPTISLEATEWRSEPSHRSLRSAIETSWTSLTGPERAALSQLTVFRSGFTLESAQAVIDVDTARGSTVEQILVRLRESSLIHAVSADDENDRQMRWDMYEAIREYAGEFDRHGALERHATHFARLAAAHAFELGGPDEAATRTCLRREHADLRAAFEHSVSRDGRLGIENAASIALVLYELHRTNKPALALPPLTRVLDRVQEDARALRARLFISRGECHRRVGASSHAEADFRAARGLTRPDTEEHARLDIEESMLASWRGDSVCALEGLRRAIAFAEEAGLSRLESEARIALGEILDLCFHDREALTQFAQAAQRASELRDSSQLRHLQIKRACYHVFHPGEEDPTEALESAIRTAHQQGDGDAEALAEQILGLFFLDQGAPIRSRSHLENARHLSTKLGLRRHHACTSQWLGMLSEEHGPPESVAKRIRQTVEVLREIGDRRTESLALLSVSTQAALEEDGDLERAYQLLEEGERLGTRYADDAIVLLAELQRGRIELIESGRMLKDGSIDEANSLRLRAKQRVGRARSRTVMHPERESSGRLLLDSSPEARWAFRLFERELAAAETSSSVLRIEKDGGAFQCGEERVELPNGPVIRRALQVLARHRQNAPGEALNVEALVERCWPGERIQEDAASQRARQVISRLRRSGIGTRLLRTDAGYMLDPSVEIEIVTHLP